MKIIYNWSSGKDSAMGLYRLLRKEEHQIHGLLTTISKKFSRISMHGVREELLEEQAKLIGLPLYKVYIPDRPDMVTYEKELTEKLVSLKNEGVTVSAFGDIFLEDLRQYRESRLNEIGMKALFPLWKEDTHSLIREFLDTGFKTIVTCVNGDYLDESFVGRVIDHDFLADLPPNVDPCGEHGEFHTFVFDGPLFSSAVKYRIGEKVCRTYDHPENGNKTPFWYCDLVKE